MAKVIDITEKLSFEENPRLCVRDTELEVQADARTVLKMMSIMSDGQPTNRDVLDCLNLLLSERDRAKLDEMNLSFKDYMAVVYEAMNLATGDASEKTAGETQTHTMT
jgi:hypothetical protein